MNFFSYIWNGFVGLFREVGSTHPPSEPELVTEILVEGELDRLAGAVRDVAVKVAFDPRHNPAVFACADGTALPEELYPNATKLGYNLYVLAKELGKEVVVVEGFRTEAYNKHIGGSKTSTHLTGLGAHIKIKGMGRERLAAKIKTLIKEGKLEKGGVAVYSDGVHYDVRGKNRSWVGKLYKK